MDQQLQADEFLGEWFMDQTYDIGGCPLAGCNRRTLRQAVINLILKVRVNATENAKRIVGE